MAEGSWSITAGGVTVTRLAASAMTMLRLRGFDQGALNAVDAVLGTALPREPNHAAGAQPRVLWMGPGEWLIVGLIDTGAILAASAGAGVAHVADIGAGRVAYAVSGPDARALLAKGCTLDLHRRAFAAGRCAQTLFAQVSALIDRPADGGGFVIHVEASHAYHLESWFADAAIEFRIEDSAWCYPGSS